MINQFKKGFLLALLFVSIATASSTQAVSVGDITITSESDGIHANLSLTKEYGDTDTVQAGIAPYTADYKYLGEYTIDANFAGQSTTQADIILPKSTFETSAEYVFEAYIDGEYKKDTTAQVDIDNTDTDQGDGDQDNSDNTDATSTIAITSAHSVEVKAGYTYFVQLLTANDANASFAIVGGADADLFNIWESDLNFVDLPQVGEYRVQVQATAGQDTSSVEDVIVSVVGEGGEVDPVNYDILVTSVEQHPNTTIPVNAIDIPFTSFTLTAGDKDVDLYGIKIDLPDFFDDALINNIKIIDENGNIIVSKDYIYSDITFNLKINARESKTFTIFATLGASAKNYITHKIALPVINIDYNYAYGAQPSINGLPIAGSEYEIIQNENINRVQITPIPLATTTVYAGDNNAKIASFSLEAVDNNLTVQQLTFSEYGSYLTFKKIKAVKIKHNNTYYAARTTIFNEKIIVYLDEGIVLQKGEKVDIEVIAEIPDPVYYNPAGGSIQLALDDYVTFTVTDSAIITTGGVSGYNTVWNSVVFPSISIIKRLITTENTITITSPVVGDEWKIGVESPISWNTSILTSETNIIVYLDKLVDGVFTEVAQIKKIDFDIFEDPFIGIDTDISIIYLPGDYYIRVEYVDNNLSTRSDMFTLLPAEPTLRVSSAHQVLGFDNDLNIIIKHQKMKEISVALYKDGALFKWIDTHIPVEYDIDGGITSTTVSWNPREFLATELARGDVPSSASYKIYVTGIAIDEQEIHSITEYPFQLLLDKDGIQTALLEVDRFEAQFTVELFSIREYKQDVLDGKEQGNIEELDRLIRDLQSGIESFALRRQKIETLLHIYYPLDKKYYRQTFNIVALLIDPIGNGYDYTQDEHAVRLVAYDPNFGYISDKIFNASINADGLIMTPHGNDYNFNVPLEGIIEIYIDGKFIKHVTNIPLDNSEWQYY